MGYRYPGSHRFICDVCNLEYRSEQKRIRWDGKVVCEWDYETRHPLEFVRTRIEDNSVPNPRPPTEPVFINDEVTFGLITELNEQVIDEQGNALQVPLGII